VLRRRLHDRGARKPWKLFVLLSCTAFTATFGYHAIYGRHGLEARTKLIQRSAELNREIKSLEIVQAEFIIHNSQLGKDPSKDLIEEIAKRDLGFAYPDEHIIHSDRQ